MELYQCFNMDHVFIVVLTFNLDT